MGIQWIFKRKIYRRKRRSVSKSSQAHYEAHKEKARAVVEVRLAYWNEFYKHLYKRVAIRNQKSRWGSCSSKRNLNFNYRIIFLPELLIDYIIVHELCHLAELNHSARFWEHVELALPDYVVRRAQLRAVSLDAIAVEI
ncbi:MAG: M48 family metallopeptidase [Candidatus Pacebacteria bacterium]|nr:M48 family metallopeptidase [Candidatus Paceibacterota bacterium]MCF7857134.1 M48 family metallopeptidase [Candidatus Paceibacterota bacterium]